MYTVFRGGDVILHNSIILDPYNVMCPYYRGVLIERYHAIEYKYNKINVKTIGSHCIR